MHTFCRGNVNYVVSGKVAALIYDNLEDPTWIALREVEYPSLSVLFMHRITNFRLWNEQIELRKINVNFKLYNNYS